MVGVMAGARNGEHVDAFEMALQFGYELAGRHRVELTKRKAETNGAEAEFDAASISAVRASPAYGRYSPSALKRMPVGASVTNSTVAPPARWINPAQPSTSSSMCGATTRTLKRDTNHRCVGNRSWRASTRSYPPLQRHENFLTLFALHPS